MRERTNSQPPSEGQIPEDLDSSENADVFLPGVVLSEGYIVTRSHVSDHGSRRNRCLTWYAEQYGKYLDNPGTSRIWSFHLECEATEEADSQPLSPPLFYPTYNVLLPRRRNRRVAHLFLTVPISDIADASKTTPLQLFARFGGRDSHSPDLGRVIGTLSLMSNEVLVRIISGT